jgi:glucoamylase
MIRFSTFAQVLVCFVFATKSLSTAAQVPLTPRGEAPREGMVRQDFWSSGNKQYFGTSYEAYGSSGAHDETATTAPISKVWFTGAQGVLTEVFWPTLDRKQTRDTQFLVTDGRSFMSEERQQTTSSVEWVEEGVPAFRVVTRDPRSRFRIEKTIWSHPSRPVVLQRVRFVRLQSGLRLHVLHNPSVANTPFGDSARASMGAESGLFAWQQNDAQALLVDVPFRQVSAGFVGANDGFQDLASDFRMDAHFERATDGNVALTAWFDLPEEAGSSEFTMALGFGDDVGAARVQAAAALAEANESLDLFRSQWGLYQTSVRNLGRSSLDGGKLFRASVAILKSMEDKTYSGAFVASPSMPWGLLKEDSNYHYPPRGTGYWTLPPEAAGRQYEAGGYHLVWPRDLYQMATTFLALGDPASAVASLRYLRKVQFGPGDGVWRTGDRVTARDGSWLQNGWLNGEPYWTQLQLDQTALPLLLAYRLWREGHLPLAEISEMSLRAARFIVRAGPWSAQERWEENMGASPSTIASQIAALWVAAEIAEAAGLPEEAQVFRGTADSWNSSPGNNLEAWTFTETGPHGNGKYFVRVTGSNGPRAPWDPNSEAYIQVTNGGPRLLEKEVTDGGFLELVRLGVRRARDYHVMESIGEMDATLRVDTRFGPGFFRYVGDRYNMDESTGQATKGMLWPFLTGERGHYEIAKASEEGRSGSSLDAVSVPFIAAMEAFATDAGLLPEQVWDAGPQQGRGTSAATPLGWTHGEYVKLLRSRADAAVVDRLEAVQTRSLSLE